MNESMLYVVSYDIPDDKRRTRVHSALTGFGTWVQFSVFECFLDRKQRMLLQKSFTERDSSEGRYCTHLWSMWRVYSQSGDIRPGRCAA